MIKIKENCTVEDVQRQLKLQLEFDPDSKVIAIVPIQFRSSHLTFGAPTTSFVTTHVNIIWNSK